MICAAEGCEETATHHRTFTVSAPAWGEIETTLHLCCPHLDMLASEEPPILDIVLAGRVREPS